MIPSNFRQLTYLVIHGEKIENNEIVNDFVNYIQAYCAELKLTDYDIVLNDDLYNMVYDLFDSVILKRKYQIS